MTTETQRAGSSHKATAMHHLRYQLDRLSRDTHPDSYAVAMRISDDHGPGAWAAYTYRVRTDLGIAKAEAARRADITRLTWGRWERGETVPDDADLIARVADLAGDTLAVAMAAAGVKSAQAAESVAQDEELRIIRESAAPERVKKALTEYVLRRREEQARERREAIELALKTQY